MIIDVYPVGLLADVRRAWNMFWRDPRPNRRRVVAYLAANVRRSWRRKSYWNGYLAEPNPFPDSALTRCGSGWTRGRAMRDLRRRAHRAGVSL